MFFTYKCLLRIVLVVGIWSPYPILSWTPLNGRYTKSIHTYNLTVPHKINSLGEFVSFDLPHFFQYEPSESRRKRTLEDSDMVHYGVTLNGQDYHIDLWPNHNFISPDLIVEHRDPKLRKETERVKRLDRERVCHYTGVVRGQRDSRAAISTCDGLAGYVTIDNKRYFIEPMEHHQPNAEGHHLHVIHQDHHVDKRSVHCGTTGDWREAWKNSFREKFMENQKEEKRGVTSEHRYLETIVVGDKKFLTHHKNNDVELYVMTVMNMVSDFYHDASSGNQMDVVVVRIMYLEKEEEEIDLAINENAEKTLESFCNWQVKINPKDVTNPNHHDIAVLLTRYDICADEGADCGLMGLAYIATACTQNKNCAINEDGGLTLGIVVAHEMGHVMGCAHDKEGESPCAAKDKDESYFVMAPFVHMYTTKWSSCSRGFITSLFENNMGDCLNDEPEVSIYAYKAALPGTIYDPEQQCDLMFPGSSVCMMDESKFCEMLLCKTTPTECTSNREPPADGTKCGSNKWCFHKKCIEIGERPEAINGGWGSWGPYSTCSRTCGGGVSISERNCDNPIPQFGGRFCLGDRKRFKICNKDPCPLDEPTFRDQQCTEQNSKPFNGKLHKWRPYYKKGEPCVLYCKNELNTFAKLQPRVKDGTPCKAGTKNLCISGKCMNVGCDFQLDSDAVEDVCGICNGDGTQCKIVDEVYKDTGAHDYKKVALIPQGSRNVRIEELAPSMNTIAVSDKSEKVFYLNGGHRENRDGTKVFGKGVEGVYDHPEPGKETLIIHGPTREDLIFFVCFYDQENVGYRYRYSEPTADLNYAPQYHWELLDWSDCSLKCGGGIETSKYDCVEEKAGKVSSTFCAGEPKPPVQTKPCNENPCMTKWKVGKWGPCRACKNLSGLRAREVECVRENPKIGAEDILVEDEECDDVRPASKELCNSPKKCKVREAEQMPQEMAQEIWRQINKRKIQNRRDLNIDKLLEAIESNTVADSCKTLNKTMKNFKQKSGGLIKDRIPQSEINVVKIPFKQSHSALNLSDNAFETMGDTVGDKLDTGEAVIATGADAAKILKELGHNEQEREDLLTSTKKVDVKKKDTEKSGKEKERTVAIKDSNEEKVKIVNNKSDKVKANEDGKERKAKRGNQKS
ncbi:unnamed protein product [Psylliodes chrysocephalus]|uniref:Peptidase M12B domain-containing protein n=1 Tax=Psylliodes chrysocephalus TaxID=3402493 RepID=A0A9P0GH55_9CUCU|nr:unnamed protein product [Psylliodes chrysocephala]